MSLSEQDMRAMQSFYLEKSGYALELSKQYLLETKLTPLVAKHNVETITNLIAKAKIGNKDIETDIIEAMTINETYFFRDQKPFDTIKDEVFPTLIQQCKESGKKDLKIWCAACSSGQEPYSLAMMIKENAFKFAGLNTQIIGTDLSSNILDRAKKGIYTQFEVQRGMPTPLLMKYFTMSDQGWAINDDIKSMVEFRHLNLMNMSSMESGFDLVLCRNVLIYFNQDIKEKVLTGIVSKLNNRGFLVVGGAETLKNDLGQFSVVFGGRGFYQKGKKSDVAQPATTGQGTSMASSPASTITSTT